MSNEKLGQQTWKWIDRNYTIWRIEKNTFKVHGTSLYYRIYQAAKHLYKWIYKELRDEMEEKNI